MKLFFRFILPVLAILFFISCNKEEYLIEQKGQVQFTLDAPTSKLKSSSANDAKFVQVTITDLAGKPVYTSENIELTNFNGSFISKPISLNPGDYKLTQYLVLDASSKAIYASPIESSKLAYLVNDPLTINFNISKDITTKVNPEVLSTAEVIAADFGYSTFTFNVVKTFDFLVSVFVYNPTIQNYELTTASITIAGEKTQSFSLPIESKTNQVTVREGSNNYTITITKSLYETYSKTISVDSLKAKLNSPLIVTLKNDLKAGLLAYYPFDGNANDLSGNGKHGTNYGSILTTGIAGLINTAYNLNGTNNYIKLPETFDLNEATYSMWINSRTFPVWNYSVDPAGSVRSIYTSDNTSLTYGAISINVTNKDGKDELFVGVGSTIICEPEIMKNKWYHIVLTKNDKEIKFYIDGKLIASKVANLIHSVDGNSFTYIGTSRVATHRYFDGIVDEVKIYNRTLSQFEISLLNNK